MRVLGLPPDRRRPADPEPWIRAARAVETCHVATKSTQPAVGHAPATRVGRTSCERRAGWRRAGENVVEARARLGIATPGHGSLGRRPARGDGPILDADRERGVDRRGG